MPFIRYRIGGLGIPTNLECNCGLPFSIMKFSEGRTSDCLFDDQGRLVTSGPVITKIAKLFPEIEQFQIIQKEKNVIEVRVKKNSEFHESTESLFIQELHGFFGNSMIISLFYVECFIQNKSGKHRPLINELIR